MKDETKDTVIVLAVILTVFVSGGAGIYLYSGAGSPFSVVVSESMQHGSESRFGIIDTGDMVYVRSPSSVTIQSYVEGATTGYRSFGEYGSVIIYDRGSNANPVIHRAILWLEYSESILGLNWTAPFLKEYPGGYAVDDGSPDTGMKGVLIIHNIGYAKQSVTIDLDSLNEKSGYLTKGDNALTNPVLDQNSSIASNNPISMEEIRSVPVAELPALGSVKMYLQGKSDTVPANSWGVLYTQLYVVAMFFVVMMIILDMTFTFLAKRREKKRRSPTPPFPVEPF